MNTIKINLHSLYDNFTLGQKPKYIEWVKDGSGAFDIYSDDFVKDAPEGSCVLMIEPRCIPTFHGTPYDRYAYVTRNYKEFKYIFTHDTHLLTLPNAKPIIWGGVYEFNDVPKTKDISFCCSNKQFGELHRIRNELARQMRGKIDVMGTLDGGQYVSTFDIYAEYRFSVIIENYRDDYWFTEKICNCFANKTIPIYYGSRKISSFFNSEGIIQLNEPEYILTLPDAIYPNCEAYYNRCGDAIEDNYERVKDYVCFEDTFYRMYRDTLRELANDNK